MLAPFATIDREPLDGAATRRFIPEEQHVYFRHYICWKHLPDSAGQFRSKRGHHASAASSSSTTADTSSSTDTDTDSLLSQTASSTTTPNGSTPTYTLNGVALGSNINTTA
jgi:hypothetical protein